MALDQVTGAVEGERLPETMVCKVCRRTDGVMKCGGCEIVTYCGRECQRLDWRTGHRQACKR